MINKTKYLQLKKPDGDEFYDIDVFNENADSIDGELKKNNEELAKKLSRMEIVTVILLLFRRHQKEKIFCQEKHIRLFLEK